MIPKEREIGFEEGVEWAAKKVVEIDGKAGDDLAFRLMIKAAFLKESWEISVSSLPSVTEEETKPQVK